MDGERLSDIVSRKSVVNTDLASGPPRDDVVNRLLKSYMNLSKVGPSLVTRFIL
ncbi:MAG: hypothetical protein CM15mP62_19800 [Rhodospirillaceae bacterium]|nr:MAG: hypothetical protein CM15mP62_19800 [Rhodospirillaceae bacterium]